MRPSRLHDHEVLVGDVWRSVCPHVGGHVGHHVAERVERPHRELQQEPAQHGQQAVQGNVLEDDVVEGSYFRHFQF